jgi:hypothetical protein
VRVLRYSLGVAAKQSGIARAQPVLPAAHPSYGTD